MGGDKGYDTHEFVAECRHMDITPHVAQNEEATQAAAWTSARLGTGATVSQKKAEAD